MHLEEPGAEVVSMGQSWQKLAPGLGEKVSALHCTQEEELVPAVGL